MVVPRVYSVNVINSGSTSQKLIWFDEGGRAWLLYADTGELSPYSSDDPFSYGAGFTTSDCTGAEYTSLYDLLPGFVFVFNGSLKQLPKSVHSIGGAVVTLRSFRGSSGTCSTSYTSTVLAAPTAQLAALPSISRPAFPYLAPLHPDPGT